MLNGLCREQRLASTDAKSTSPKVPNSHALPEFQRVCLSAAVSDSKTTKKLLSHIMGASQMHQNLIRTIRRLWPIKIKF